MDSYSNLLHHVLDTAKLREAIDQLVKDYPTTVNLIAENWETRLEKNEWYRQFKKDARRCFQNSVHSPGLYHYQELNKDIECCVLVASECRILHPYEGKNGKSDISISTVNAKPLEKIARAMFSDFESTTTLPLSNEFKFKFTMCSNIGCSGCSAAHDTYKQNKVRVKQMKQPCIFYTSVFDGEEFRNFFLSTIGECFPRVFNAILQIKLTSRYDYVDQESQETCYRIGGEVQEIIAFKQNVFKLSAKRFRLGNLTSLAIAAENEESGVEEEMKANEVKGLLSYTGLGGNVGSGKEWGEEGWRRKKCEDERVVLETPPVHLQRRRPEPAPVKMEEGKERWL